jgi:hypothetical protein
MADLGLVEANQLRLRLVIIGDGSRRMKGVIMHKIGPVNSMDEWEPIRGAKPYDVLPFGSFASMKRVIVSPQHFGHPLLR